MPNNIINDEYKVWLKEIKNKIYSTQIKSAVAVNQGSSVKTSKKGHKEQFVNSQSGTK